MSLLAACLSFSLNLVLALTPPPTTAVAYDLSGFKVENGLIHFNDTSQPIDPSAYGKVRFVENNKGVIIEAKKSDQLRLMRQISEKQGYDQIVNFEVRCFYIPVDQLQVIGIEKEQVDVNKAPILRRPKSKLELALYEIPNVTFEFSPEQIKTVRKMFSGKHHGELGKMTYLFPAGKKVTTASWEYEVTKDEAGEIIDIKDREVVFEQPLFAGDIFPQFDIACHVDSNDSRIDVRFVDRSMSLEKNPVSSEMVVHQKIKLGNSVLLVDLTTILDLSDEGFELSSNGEVPDSNHPKMTEGGESIY